MERLYNVTIMNIGFIGQGFIGKSYADDMEARGYSTVRYALEEPYINNREALKDCDIVFIAVPTPTTPEGYDYSIVEKAIPLTVPGTTVVIKSTMLPGTTETLQKKYPDRTILFSPEFLVAKNAADDAAHPKRNIIGVPDNTAEHQAAARSVLAVLPKAPYELICTAREAEYIKYGGNCFLYTKVLFMNVLYNVAQKDGCDWEQVASGMAADERIGSSHMHPVHDGGRGAGSPCFIKDFAAFRAYYEKSLPEDKTGAEILRALEEKNIELLKNSSKDLGLLRGVYGEDVA